MHIRSKNTGLDPLKFFPGQVYDMVEQALALRWHRCGRKTGAVAAVGISGQRELRHQQKLSAELPQVDVHPAGFIRKNSVCQHALHQSPGLVFAVTALNPDESKDAGLDFALYFSVNNDGRFGYSLYQRNHGFHSIQKMIYAAKFFLWLLSLMPAGMPYWLSGKGAKLWMRLSPVKRHTAERNLERCYPEMSGEERDRLVLDSFRHYLCAILETGRNWYWPLEKLQSLCDGIENEKLIWDSLETGRGGVALAPHFGAWEYLGMYLQGIEDIAILYKPPSNPALGKALLSRRRRGGGNLIPATASGLRKLYAHIRAGKGAGILPDQQPSAGQGRFAPFFGNQALTGVLVPRLVQRTNCVVVATVCERLEGGRYKVHMLEVDDEIYSADLVTSLAAMNRAIEQCIAIDPAQYLWSYRRFKAQPKGAEPFYDVR